MKCFLIVKASSIGDVTQSFHLIPYLKRRFPGAAIDWVVEKGIAPLLRAHPDLRNIIEVDTKLWRRGLFEHRRAIGAFRKKLRKERYDALFDLQGTTKSAAITAMARAEKKVGFSWRSVPEKPNYLVTNVHICCNKEKSVRGRYSRLLLDFFGDDTISEAMEVGLRLCPEEEAELQRMCQLGFQNARIMVCFGSRWANKQLSDEALEEFLKRIQEKISPTFYFVWADKEEKRRADQLEASLASSSHVIGGMSLALWQRLMGKMDVVISMDSAALHLCATTKTPSFSFFGPSSSAAYKPSGSQHAAFQGTCPYSISFEKRCPHLRSCHTGACLKGASPDLIFSHFSAFWDLEVRRPQLVGSSASLK